MDAVEKLRRAKTDGSTGFVVAREDIGEYLKAAGIKAGYQDLLMCMRECAADEDGVQFTKLEKWLRRQTQVNKSLTQNPLLVTKRVGKTTATSYDLLGANHTYGVKVVRDKEHGADVIFKWHAPVQSNDGDKDVYVDRVKMNKAAVKKGRTTAKQFVEHSRSNKQYTSLKKKAKMQNTTRGQPLKVDKFRTFGRTKQRETPGMQDLLQSKFNPSVTEEETDYVAVSGSQRAKKAARQERRAMRDAKLTTAQRLRDKAVRQTMNPDIKPKFIMRQFKNIPSRLSASGRDIVGST